MRALVLSGGGSKGSWQVGALKAIVEHDLGEDGFRFISGTSVGALNAAGLGMFPNTGFKESVDFLEGLWREKLKIWKLAFPWYIIGLWKPYIGSNRGLKKFIDKHLDVKKIKGSGVGLCFSAVDIESGALKRFDEDFKDLKGAILASSSFPIAFPPQKVGKQHYTDGGVRDIAPLKPAIEAGADEIVVIMTADPFTPVKSDLPGNAVSMAMRVVDLLTTEVLFNDIQKCQEINSRLQQYPAQYVGKRRISVRYFWPSKELTDSLDFKRKTMRKQIEQGYEETKKRLGLK